MHCLACREAMMPLLFATYISRIAPYALGNMVSSFSSLGPKATLRILPADHRRKSLETIQSNTVSASVGSKYDFQELTTFYPDLRPYVLQSPSGSNTINFSDPKAIKSLNTALLKVKYGLSSWEFPEGYLCPPIPERAEYIHCIAELLKKEKKQSQKHDKTNITRGIDIGTGASCIYSLIGTSAYGWQFVGTDIDSVAIASARQNVEKNGLSRMIDIRLQTDAKSVFAGTLQRGERFDFCMVNPPFYSSLVEAGKSSSTKWRNLLLNKKHRQSSAAKNEKCPLGNVAVTGKVSHEIKPLLFPAVESGGKNREAFRSFGGSAKELCCDGGEMGFVTRMINESSTVIVRNQIRWFTTLISKKSNLSACIRLLKSETIEARRVKVIDMSLGNKQSRILAWTFSESAAATVRSPQKWGY